MINGFIYQFQCCPTSGEFLLGAIASDAALSVLVGTQIQFYLRDTFCRL